MVYRAGALGCDRLNYSRTELCSRQCSARPCTPALAAASLGARLVVDQARYLVVLRYW
jgi:hypothetical protein